MGEERPILLVEDQPDDAALTLRALSKNGITHQVIVAHDGHEALEHLFGEGALPQLVLLDLMLPGLDGWEVLGRIRADERTRLLPVVVLSSSLDQQAVTRAYRLGANRCVPKPIDFTSFTELVRLVGAYCPKFDPPAPRLSPA